MYNLHDSIASVSYECFNSLPKSGKPKLTEWTVMSTIVMERDGVFTVVALATGSKCIGQNQMSAKGDLLNDSHAEVLCRRAFLEYIYNELTLNSEIFDLIDSKFTLRNKIRFHFFTTHVPCGDAAIFAKNIDKDIGTLVSLDANEPEIKRRKLDDIYRTGAKCVSHGDKKDDFGEGSNYHCLGAVRLKPGRGDPTLSVSCSDKIAKWCHLGVQGALLTLLLKEPIYLSSFTIAPNTPFDELALNRALYTRLRNDLIFVGLNYKRHEVTIGISKKTFDFAKTTDKQACPSSVVFSKIKETKIQVSVEGRKQGITKKQLKSKSARLRICKVELFRKFLSILKEFKLDLCEGNARYGDVKNMCSEYNFNWNLLKSKGFGVWSEKNKKLLEFTID